MANRPIVIDAAQRTAAKVAALAYLIPVALVIYANFGMRGRLFAGDDTAETVRRIQASEPLFRLSVAFDVVYCTGVVVLLTAFYVILSPINRHLALLAALWKLVYGVTAVLMALNFLSAVRLTSNEFYAQALEAEPLQGLVRLYTSSTSDQYYVGLVFWALSATAFAWLWLKSRYIPTWFAWFGLVSSAWCALCAIAYIITPGFAKIVNLWWFDTPMSIFDVGLSFWLLFRGLPRSGPTEALR